MASDCSIESWEKFWQAEHCIGPQENSDYNTKFFRYENFGKPGNLLQKKKVLKISESMSIISS